MEDQFYIRPTGKLKSVHYSSYGSKDGSRKDKDSIYSLGENDIDYGQYPWGELSVTQMKFINTFMNSIQSKSRIEVDPCIRVIYWIGLWRIPDNNITISCTLMQPNIGMCMISLSGVKRDLVKEIIDRSYSQGDPRTPSMNKTGSYCQIMGRNSIQFVDELVRVGVIGEEKVSHVNMTLVNTQPIFSIVQDNTTYECKLTHESCKVIESMKLNYVNISRGTSTGHNFSFRSANLRDGRGTGPNITVHSAGTIQYNGSPLCIEEVTRTFKRCLDDTMCSDKAVKFLRSLGVVRTIPIDSSISSL